MHLQVRTAPAASPPDVERLLRRLKEHDIDLAAVGGSNVEFGGEFAFVPKDGQEDRAFSVLDQYGYKYRVLHTDNESDGLTLCQVDDVAGGLHGCLAGVAEQNLQKGRIIRDILIGIQEDDDQAGKIPVHIYSEQVRTSNSLAESS
jgi:hypothetical protein